MLSEDQIVDAVCSELARRGWTILSRAGTTERGADVRAAKDNRVLVVEAKGETSNRATSARYGKPFDSGQIVDHIGKALVQALIAISDGNLGAIALPAEARHRRVINKMSAALAKAGVIVLWVLPDGTTVDGGDGL